MLATPSKAKMIRDNFFTLYGRSFGVLSGKMREALLDSEVLRVVMSQDEATTMKSDDIRNLKDMAKAAIISKVGDIFS